MIKQAPRYSSKYVKKPKIKSKIKTKNLFEIKKKNWEPKKKEETPKAAVLVPPPSPPHWTWALVTFLFFLKNKIKIPYRSSALSLPSSIIVITMSLDNSSTAASFALGVERLAGREKRTTLPPLFPYYYCTVEMWYMRIYGKDLSFELGRVELPNYALPCTIQRPKNEACLIYYMLSRSILNFFFFLKKRSIQREGRVKKK